MNYDYSNPEYMNLAMDWAVERYLIHKRKDVQKLPQPWTTKKGFEYRYCNVMRRHDRQSINIIESVCTNPELTLREKMLNIIIFRMYNKFNTFDLLGFPRKEKFTPEEVLSYNEKYKEYMRMHEGYNPFTGAFMVSGLLKGVGILVKNEYNVKFDNAVNVMYYFNYIFDNFNAERYVNMNNVRELLDTFIEDTCLMGFGDFLKYQVYLDWCYCTEWPEHLNADHETMSGPGCTKGIWTVFTSRNITMDEFNKKLRDDDMSYEDILKIFRDNTSKYFTDYGVDINELLNDLPENERTIILSDWENIMCEFSKYYTLLYTDNSRKSKLRNYVPTVSDVDSEDW